MNAMNTRLGRPPQFSLGQLLIAITALGVVFGLPHQFPNFSVMITGICLSALNVVQLPRTTPERSCVPGVFGWIAGWLMGGLALGILDPTGIRYFMADPAIIAAMCGVLGVCTCPLGAAIGFGTGAVLEELDSCARVSQWVKAHRCPARLLLRRVRR